MYRVYNLYNLKHFTKSNAGYYGKKGGLISGKNRLKKKIRQISFQISFLQYELSKYLNRERIYNWEYELIKNKLHELKILKNRYHKILKKIEEKYNESEREIFPFEA